MGELIYKERCSIDDRYSALYVKYYARQLEDRFGDSEFTVKDAWNCIGGKGYTTASMILRALFNDGKVKRRKCVARSGNWTWQYSFDLKRRMKDSIEYDVNDVCYEKALMTLAVVFGRSVFNKADATKYVVLSRSKFRNMFGYGVQKGRLLSVWHGQSPAEYQFTDKFLAIVSHAEHDPIPEWHRGFPGVHLVGEEQRRYVQIRTLKESGLNYREMVEGGFLS